jgi:hypothetical protein
MIIVPLYILIIFYLIFLLFFAFFGLFGVYHLVKFGFQTFGTFILIFLFLDVSVIILFASYQFISQIDWMQEITVFEYSVTSPYF